MLNTNTSSRKKICIVTTVESSMENWIVPFLDEYHNRAIDVTLVCNMTLDQESSLKNRFDFVKTESIPFPRGINVTGSLKSVFELFRLFRRGNFDLVQYSTPNASMYASLASYFAGVPTRLYCQWGMVFMSMSGVKRLIFMAIEKLVCRLSTRVQPDSKGNLDYCRSHGFYDESKSNVIWNGSAKGLNLDEFDLSKKDEYSHEIKTRYGIKEDCPVVGFVGRLGRDKCCNELLAAFRDLVKDRPDAVLLFVGPIEKRETIEPELLAFFDESENVVKTNRVNDVHKHMAAMDLLILPSYREGFGMSVVEASAMALPVVVTEYPGPSSAVLPNKTGLVIPIADSQALKLAISQLLDNPNLAKSLGMNGRSFVEESFNFNIFKEKLMEDRLTLLGIGACHGR